MARCLRCGNTSRFNMWCSIQKVLKVEVNEKEELIEICGEPENEIVRICKQEKIELLIVGSHGHKFIKDIVYGSTVHEVRHRIRVPVLAIPIEVT